MAVLPAAGRRGPTARCARLLRIVVIAQYVLRARRTLSTRSMAGLVDPDPHPAPDPDPDLDPDPVPDSPGGHLG
ncbi:hypothetical protein Bra3105_08910 [Brachybacterium halotolerans subsp. kimchii]|uniref:hypothetical protein n=1 Tax=Brachybacterium halotolerans TaxID=2795215 RepID=UPI001E5C0A7E|nr:hypothetical protein [Brachybacterium halotolerans]UEJ84406.1 hypothetical protein Bra3105_08910 [Brachybacterium halotolerans subsp. kimchii]